MADVDLYINDYISLSYLKKEINTNNINIISDKKYEEYEIQEKSHIFDPQSTGTYSIEYNGNVITVNVFGGSKRENFEHNNLSDNYIGGLSQFKISSTSYSGSYSLRTGQNEVDARIYNKDFLMSDGVTFSGWAYTNDQYLGYGFLLFADSDTGERYEFGQGSQNFELDRVDSNGNKTSLFNSGEIMSTNTWYNYILTRDGNSFDIKIEDSDGNVKVNDTVKDPAGSIYRTGSLGFHAGDSGYSAPEKIYYDNIEVKYL